MKKLILGVLLFAAVNVATAEVVSQQDRTAVVAGWAGYITGAFAGSLVATKAVMTVVPVMTTTGVAVGIVSAPLIPILFGTAAGAVAGAGLGYGGVRLYQHLNSRDVLARSKQAIDNANLKAIEVRDDVIARLTTS